MILVIAVSIILGGGYFYFDKQVLNGQSDLDEKSQQEQKTELVTNKEYDDLPEVIALKKQEAELKQQGVSENEEDRPTEGTTKVIKNTPSQADIENRLRGKLSSLQGEYNGKLGGLIASAKKEYNQITSGQKSGSKSDLAKKYLGLAQGLESQCDARVYAAIAFAENELLEYGYQSDLPEQAREAYQQQKKERRKQLLSKI